MRLFFSYSEVTSIIPVGGVKPVGYEVIWNRIEKFR